MNIFTKILKEVGITFAMIVILGVVTILVFQKQLPYDTEIPPAPLYESKSDQYVVDSNDRLAAVIKRKIVHETNSNQIVKAEDDIRITTGKETPFGRIGTENDLPLERVNRYGQVQSTSGVEDSNADNAAENDGNKYPIRDIIGIIDEEGNAIVE